MNKERSSVRKLGLASIICRVEQVLAAAAILPSQPHRTILLPPSTQVTHTTFLAAWPLAYRCHFARYFSCYLLKFVHRRDHHNCAQPSTCSGLILYSGIQVSVPQRFLFLCLLSYSNFSSIIFFNC